MPELPEIVNFKRYIDSTSLHQTIQMVEITNEKILNNTSPEELQKAFEGQQFESTDSHGKYLSLKTDDKNELIRDDGSSCVLQEKRADTWLCPADHPF